MKQSQIKSEILNVFRTRFKNAGVKVNEIIITYRKNKPIEIDYDNIEKMEMSMAEGFIMKNFLVSKLQSELSKTHKNAEILVAITTINLNSEVIKVDAIYNTKQENGLIFKYQMQ